MRRLISLDYLPMLINALKRELGMLPDLQLVIKSLRAWIASGWNIKARLNTKEM